MRNYKQSIVLLLTLLTACGTSGSTSPDGPPSTGAHHQYVINGVQLPVKSGGGAKYGLDLGSKTSNAPDGTVDNGLANILSSLSSAAGSGSLNLQTATDNDVAKGTMLMLVDLQTTDFTTAHDAGVRTLLGANPMPAPCTNPNDVTTCGQHLKGIGSFTVAADDPANSALVGDFTSGQLDSKLPGQLVVQLVLTASASPVTLNLEDARVRVTGAGSAKIDNMILAGAITQTDVDGQILPAIKDVIDAQELLDCGAQCGSCKAGSTGATMVSLFGCMPSVDQLKANANLQQLLAPDVCIEASCAKADGLSFGVGATAIAGAFTP
jgi:hypothetical protein